MKKAASSGSGSAHPPDHASVAPKRWQLGYKGTLITIAIALAFAFARDWVPRWWASKQQAQRWQQCMNYSAPADQIAYSEDPAEISRLRFGGQPCIIESGAVPHMCLLPPAEVQIIHPVSLPGPFLFLHGRQASGKPVRAVTVQIFGRPDETWGSRFMTFLYSVADPSIHRESNVIRSWQISPPAQGKPLTIWAGQPDSQDDSHFTIRYAMGELGGTIDGWLMPDDTVRLKIRDGPVQEIDPKDILEQLRKLLPPEGNQ